MNAPALLGFLLAAAPPLTNGTPTLAPVRVEAARPAEEPTASWRLTRREIEQSGARTAAEALAAAPGVRLERRGGPAQFATLLVRGASHEQLLVLVDGVPYNPPQGGGADLSLIPAASIETIELLRGGTASQAVGNGLAGILRITTRAATATDPARLEAGLGSFGERSLAAVLPLASGPWSCRIAASHARGAGAFRYPGLVVVHPDGCHSLDGAAVTFANTGYQTSTASLAFTHASGSTRQRLSAEWLVRESGAPGSIEFPTGEATLSDRRLALRYALTAGDAFSVEAHTLFQERRYQDALYAPEAQRQENIACGLQARWRFPGPFGSGDWETGLSLRREALDAAGYGENPPDPRWGFAPTLGIVLPLGPSLRLAPALRLDLASEAPPLAAAGASLGWEPGGPLGVQASFGSAFRRPSFADLFHSGTAFAAGNPALRAERSLGGELGLRFAPDGLPRLSVRGYHSRIDDWILWQPSAGGVWRPMNLDGVRLTGLELEAGYRTLAGPGLLLEGSAFYTLQSARDVSGHQLPRRPRETAGLRLAATLEHAGHLFLQADYTGFRFLNRANSKYLPGRLVVDLGLGGVPFAGVDVRLTVRNLFDHRHIDLREYPVPGRELGLALSWSFFK